jgi:hypothetical protein
VSHGLPNSKAGCNHFIDARFEDSQALLASLAFSCEFIAVEADPLEDSSFDESVDRFDGAIKLDGDLLRGFKRTVVVRHGSLGLVRCWTFSILLPKEPKWGRR